EHGGSASRAVAAFEAVDRECRGGRPMARREPRSDGVQPTQGAAIVIFVMADEQSLRKSIHPLGLKQEGPNHHGSGYRRPRRCRRRYLCVHGAISSRAAMSGLTKLSVSLATAHHLLTVSVEGIVDDGFRRDQFVVVLEPKMPEAFGNRVQCSGLRLIPQRVVSIGAVDDLCQQDDGRITCESVLFHEAIE